MSQSDGDDIMSLTGLARRMFGDNSDHENRLLDSDDVDTDFVRKSVIDDLKHNIEVCFQIINSRLDAMEERFDKLSQQVATLQATPNGAPQADSSVPPSSFQLRSLVDAFNSIRFDPKSEKAVEFLDRFDEVYKKLHAINPNILSPEYVKHIFEGAISETLTYAKAELNSFKFNLSELRDMLLDEQLRNEQSPYPALTSPSMFRSEMASMRGRMKKRGGKVGSIPSKTKSKPVRKKPKGQSSVIKRQFCVYCKTRGHSRETCFKANKLCFNCGQSDQHTIQDCPLPIRTKPLFEIKPKIPKHQNPTPGNWDPWH